MTRSRLLKYAQSDNCNLRLNERHQTAASHALKVYRSEAIYSFIPKNACSTMRLSLAIANGCIADASGFKWIHQNNDTFLADLGDLIQARYTFVILRDPFARLASCFLDKIVAQRGPARALRAMVAPDLALDEITFAAFVDYLADPTVLSGDMHWRPQSDFLVYDRYDDYFAVENFAAAISAIKDRAGLEVKDARPWTAHGLDRYRFLPAAVDHSNTPAIEIARLKSEGWCPDPRSLYTRRIGDAVARLYGDDLRLTRRRLVPPPCLWLVR